MRSPNGRTPYAYPWANAPNWAGLEMDNNATAAGYNGLSLAATVQQVQSMNVEPILVRRARVRTQ